MTKTKKAPAKMFMSALQMRLSISRSKVLSHEFSHGIMAKPLPRQGLR